MAVIWRGALYQELYVRIGHKLDECPMLLKSTCDRLRVWHLAILHLPISLSSQFVVVVVCGLPRQLCLER